MSNRPRIYYAWHEREEFADGGGMWRVVSTRTEREQYARVAADLMGDPPRFAAAMERALRKWPKSCETNLTATANNQRAWLGHAGCFLATGAPEECTRLGWHQLDEGEQYAANAAADQVIRLWRTTYRTAADAAQLDLFEVPDA